jgi:mono/diheme cytochrome c family protein
MNKAKLFLLFGLCLGLAAGTSASFAEEPAEYGEKTVVQDYATGQPANPSEAWMRAAGGRIYDTWWDALGRDEPKTTNPAYPTDKNKKVTGADTWRCKECHGWDYQGVTGIYSKGGHFSGIKGTLGAAGRPVEELLPIFRDKNHPYTAEMINDEELKRLAIFISRGQVDMRTFLDYSTRKINAGDVTRGREIFQTTCAACHGYDGRALDWGQDGEHNYVGTEAVEVPDEVFNKIYNAHTGVQMINLRAFPVEDAISVIAYAATLPLAPPPE